MSKQIIVGSDASCDLPVAFEAVSSRHCRILFDNGEVWVEDLNSTNGTYLDGRRVEPGSLRRLRPSSNLSLAGEVSLTWEDVQAFRPSQGRQPTGNPQAVDAYESPSYEQHVREERSSPPNSHSEYAPLDHLAGFWQRSAATLLDGLILTVFAGGVMLLLLFFFVTLAKESNVRPSAAFLVYQTSYQATVILSNWIYYAAFESSAYQATPGKMALGLQVTDLEGRRVGFGKATGRHFGRYISMILLFIGFLMAAFTEKNQTLHDMMAGCLVVEEQ